MASRFTQQTPCAGETGTALKIETGKASTTRKATDEETAQCLDAIKIIYKYKDPDSLRIEGGAFVNVYIPVAVKKFCLA